MDKSTTIQLLRLSEVSSLTSLGKSTINLWVAQGKFPKPTTLSPTLKVWRIQQLTDWIDSQSNPSIAEIKSANGTASSSNVVDLKTNSCR